MNEQQLRQLLQTRRGERAGPVHFAPPIELLIDAEYCRSIHRALKDVGASWERRKAVPSLWKQLPRSAGLYMFAWMPQFSIPFAAIPKEERFPWVLYIGKAEANGRNGSTIRRRYQNEYAQYVGGDAACLWNETTPRTRHMRLARYLTLRPLEYWFLPLDNAQEVGRLERRLIELLNPPINVQHAPKLRPGKTVPAF